MHFYTPNSLLITVIFISFGIGDTDNVSAGYRQRPAKLHAESNPTDLLQKQRMKIYVINSEGTATSESRAMQLQGDMQCTQSGILIRLFGLSFPFKSDV